MKVLVIGAGGREHALAWKFAQSDKVSQVYVAPGNAGTATEPKVENIDIGAEDIDRLLTFTIDNQIALTVVGPEAPLVAGIVDRFSDHGLRCFGPTQQAAQLEGSKAFTKAFLQRHRIPTAAYAVFEDFAQAQAYVSQLGTPLVVKADGLAAGKGVTVAHDIDTAVSSIRACLQDDCFGEAGRRVVIEEFLTGEEASFICMVSGEQILPLATSQDHKARDDADLGPNTGGMGAYSPAPIIDEDMHNRIMDEIIRPTVRGLKEDGVHYLGFLYAGLMISPAGEPKVLEYNCRFGDPETQPVLLRLKSDLYELCNAAIEQNLDGQTIEWNPNPALGVVMAAGGYPEQYEKGYVITGLDQLHSGYVKVFHAGTRHQQDDTVTNGGRVLCVTALGDSVGQAQQRAYQAVKTISWKNVYYRKDIGYRAIQREIHG